VSGLAELKKFAKKIYRDGYLRTQVCGGIAYQIQAVREKFGMTQMAFAEATGKKQSTISRLEDTSYGKVSVQTLLDIACAMDVALVVKFVSYPDFLRQTENMTSRGLQPDTIYESIARSDRSSAQIIGRMPSSAALASSYDDSTQNYATPLHDHMQLNDNAPPMAAFFASAGEMRAQ
jgi:transcriptional regulator with XRE-family HTH domain